MDDGYRRAQAHFSPSGGDDYFTAGGLVFPFKDGLGPYEYLMGALSGCFTYTLEDELEAKGLPFKDISVSTAGVKRDEVPTTLEKTSIKLRIVVEGPYDEDAYLGCVHLAQEHCSMYQTIKCVSAMSVDTEVCRA